MRGRKKTEGIVQIKKSECKLFKVIHILKGLDSGTSVKTYEKKKITF